MKRTILFASEDGARARQVATLAGVEWPPVFGHGGVYDFDGDGTPELVAIVAKDVRTYAPADRIFVTMKKGAIAPYPTGASFLVDGLADVDHDGRPDLRVSLDLGKATSCAATDPTRVEVEFLAHALAGGKFSLDDAVARGWAEKRCPATTAPDALFTPPASADDLDSRDLSLSQIACERMRGKSAEAVVAEIASACAPFDEATKKCGGPCRHVADAIAVAKLAPPLALK